MSKCPICGKTTANAQCDICGFDTSRDYEAFPTLTMLPAKLPSRKGFAQLSQDVSCTTVRDNTGTTATRARWIPAAIAGAIVLTVVFILLSTTCVTGHNWMDATYEHPSICKKCGITAGHKKGYIGDVSYSYSPYGVDLGYHYGIPFIVLDTPVINCRSVDLTLYLGEAQDGTPLGNWEFYVKTTDGAWTSIGIVDVQTYDSSYPFFFETPISFTAVAATRLSTAPATHTMGYHISGVQVYTD